MAFPDPTTITIGGTAQTLARTFVKNGQGQFATADGTYVLEILPSNGKTKVRTIRLRNTKITSDPLVSTTNVRVQDLITLTIIRPLDGYSDADLVAQVAGFFTFLTAGSGSPMLTRFIAGEN